MVGVGVVCGGEMHVKIDEVSSTEASTEVPKRVRDEEVCGCADEGRWATTSLII